MSDTERLKALEEALRALGDPNARFDKTGSPNSWAEVIARIEFARAALGTGTQETLVKP